MLFSGENGIHGPVAQLGERSVRIREVESSSLFRSTSSVTLHPIRESHFCEVREFFSRVLGWFHIRRLFWKPASLRLFFWPLL